VWRPATLYCTQLFFCVPWRLAANKVQRYHRERSFLSLSMADRVGEEKTRKLSSTPLFALRLHSAVFVVQITVHPDGRSVKFETEKRNTISVQREKCSYHCPTSSTPLRTERLVIYFVFTTRDWWPVDINRERKGISQILILSLISRFLPYFVSTLFKQYSPPNNRLRYNFSSFRSTSNSSSRFLRTMLLYT